jgi:hypothetical protein
MRKASTFTSGDTKRDVIVVSFIVLRFLDKFYQIVHQIPLVGGDDEARRAVRSRKKAYWHQQQA